MAFPTAVSRSVGRSGHPIAPVEPTGLSAASMMCGALWEHRVSERRDIDELYRRHAPDAVRLAYLLTGDRAEAQDVAQDAFLAAAAKFRTLRDPSRFRAYLRRTVVRSVLMRRRSSDRESARIDRSRSGAPDRAAPAHAGVADRLDLADALDRLPARQRAALVLRYWHDLPEREIARALGCAQGTVKSLLSRALATLREEVPTDV
jgi:RNA polymerase sigma-70 factor (sigma-E family)